jgi:hypothetical protein
MGICLKIAANINIYAKNITSGGKMFSLHVAHECNLNESTPSLNLQLLISHPPFNFPHISPPEQPFCSREGW